MAYSFGGGVRPELGRTDFTPFLQGSVRGAEMQAKGAENMAAGVSQFLTKAGEGVKAYQENKAINTMFNSTVEDAIKLNEQRGGEIARMLGIADVEDKGAWAAAVKSLGEGDKKKGSMAVRSFMGQMAEQEAQRERMQGVIDPSLSPQENVQRALAAGASVGEASAIGNFLVNAQQSQQPAQAKPTSDMLNYQLAQNQGYQGSFMDFKTDMAAANRATTTISMPAQNALQAEIGKAEAERINTIVDRADKAEFAIEKLGDALSIVESGDLNTGIGATIFTNIDRLRSRFLGDKKAGKNVTNDQIIDAFLGSDVFPLIGELGIGARGIDTPAERDFLINVFTGSRPLDADALADMIRIRMNAAIGSLERYNSAVETGRLDPFFEVSTVPKGARGVPARMQLKASVREQNRDSDLGGGFRLLPN